MDLLGQLDDLYANGILDDDEYDRRRREALARLDSTSGRSTGTSLPKPRAGDGTESCQECGDVFDELAPPFCANCGAKTKYFAADVESDEDLPAPPEPEEEDSGREMLDDLLDELRSDTASSKGSSRSTASKQSSAAASRDTFALKGDERFSERETETSREAKAKAKAKAVAVGAKPALGGDAMFEALQMQMKKKQAEKAAGASKQSGPPKRPEIPAAKSAAATRSASQPKAADRSTFAVKGDERFSDRAVVAKEKQQAKKAASLEEQNRLADDLDAELAALETDIAGKPHSPSLISCPKTLDPQSKTAIEKLRELYDQGLLEADEYNERASVIIRKAESATRASVSKVSSRSTTVKAVQPIDFPDDLNDDAFDACVKLRELFDNELLDVNEYNSRVLLVMEKHSAKKPTQKQQQQQQQQRSTSSPMDIPDSLDEEAYNACLQLRELFDNELLDVTEYNSRVGQIAKQAAARGSRSTRAAVATRASTQPRDEIDFDSELAALEADLGNNLGENKGRRVTAVGSLPGSSQAAAAPKKKVQTVVTEKATKGPNPALPEGLSWHQTPVKSEMPRSTFAHAGDDRFSERPDAQLPKGVQTESPAQACNFCHKEIAPGQKFKTGLGALWHTGCFKCGVCLKLLEKGMKFFKGDLGSAICEDCKGKRRQVCYLCKQPTAKQEIVNIMGCKMHTECFRCNICDTSLLPGYVMNRGQFLCIAHRDAEPVERTWAPGEKGPGKAPARQPIVFGPDDGDRKRNAAKQHRETRSDVKAVEADLDMLAQLLEEGEKNQPREQLPSRSTRRAQLEEEEEEFFRQRESEVARESAARHKANESVRYSEVKKPSRNSGRVSEQQVQNQQKQQVQNQQKQQQQPRLSEVKKPSRNSGRQQKPVSSDEEFDDRLSSVKMMEEADKPDWQKQREAEERGSFRSNARRQQEKLDKQNGVNEDAGGYYSDSDDLTDDEPTIKITYSSKPVQQTKKR